MINDDLSIFTFGKVPPQALELEEAVLGAIMIDKDALNAVSDLLTANSFYSDANKNIFLAIVELYKNGKPIDLLMVTEQLKSMGLLDSIGGAYYLVEMTNRVASSANIEYHARIIKEKYMARELIHSASEIMKSAYDDTVDVFNLMDLSEKAIYQVMSNMSSSSVSSMADISYKYIKNLESITQGSDKLSGVPSGFWDLDKLTGGWQRTDLIILAARPSMGKTLYAIRLAYNAAKAKKPVAVFSLEMSNLQLMNRLVVAETGIESGKFRNASLSENEWQVLNKGVEELSKLPIHIDDTPGISIFELRSKARRLKIQHGIELIVVDYLQLMTVSKMSNANREQEISQISRSLKALAKELDIPIIALSQLSRAVETRGGSKKPQLSDLRESGAIEQDADIVGFLYRPQYYGIVEDEQGDSTLNLLELLVAKHRNGALGDIKHLFLPESQEIKDWNPLDQKLKQTEFRPVENNIITRPSNQDLYTIPF